MFVRSSLNSASDSDAVLCTGTEQVVWIGRQNEDGSWTNISVGALLSCGSKMSKIT